MEILQKLHDKLEGKLHEHVHENDEDVESSKSGYEPLADGDKGHRKHVKKKTEELRPLLLQTNLLRAVVIFYSDGCDNLSENKKNHYVRDAESERKKKV